MMRFALTLTSLVAAASASFAQNPGKAMQDKITAILEPNAKIVPGNLTGKPLERPVLDRLAYPVAKIPGAAAHTPKPPTISVKPVRPSVTSEGPPLSHARGEPIPPVAIVLPEQPLLRVPAIDLERPLAIPLLAVQVRDRTSITDPSLEASVAASLAPQTPVRTQPVPFSPLNLPDPFELQTQVKPRTTLEESSHLPAIQPWRPLPK
ncbi:MAG: hypothetical protein U0744_02845 [Gemmataceae bacterium]